MKSMGKKHKKHKLSSQYDGEDGNDKPPIKLVFKLGSEVMYDSDFTASSPTSVASDTATHKHKKRKLKSLFIESKIDGDSLEAAIPPEASGGPETDMDVGLPTNLSPLSIEDVTDAKKELSSNVSASPETQRLPVKNAVKKPLSPAMRKVLNNLLEQMLKQLEKKDVNEVFAWPMNDMTAVGYSSIIEKPMDFSTMKNKIITDQYFDVEEFKQDFELMIENCCVYYKNDSVYCDIAKQVLTAGRKILSKDKLLSLRKTLSFLQDLSVQEISEIFGWQLPKEESANGSDLATNNVSTPSHKDVGNSSQMEKTPAVSNFVNEKTLKNEKFDPKKLKEKVNFLHMDDEGNTTLNIVNIGKKESARSTDLGSLTGNSPSGVDVMPEAKEDKRNKVMPLEYLSYGPFSSFAPTYDSRTSNLTQEESDILLSAYGTDSGYFISQNVEEVDGSLDNITLRACNKSGEEIQNKKYDKNDETIYTGCDQLSTNKFEVDFKRLETLKDIGIDISFLKEVQSNYNKWTEESSLIDQKLNRGHELLNKLEKEQYSRLSMKMENNEPNLEPPTTTETQIAAELQKTLVDLTSAATPAAVCDQFGVRKAMGILPIT